MEVEETAPVAGPSTAVIPETIADDGRSVITSSAIQASISCELHPLVIMNVSDHWTRVRAQNEGKAEQVYGALLGKQSGRTIEICNSFELVTIPEADGCNLIDMNFLEKQLKQFKQVFQTLDLIGWYTTGGEPSVFDINVQKQLVAHNESAILLKLDPRQAKSSKLPISIFDSVIELIDKETTLMFNSIPYTLITEEGERVGLDNMARLSVNDNGDSSLASQHLRTQHSAIKMLHSRVKLILEYVKAVENGTLPPNLMILRETFSLAKQLPLVASQEFREEFFIQCNDVALQTFLATLTKCCDSINLFVNRFNILYDRQGVGRRGKRSTF